MKGLEISEKELNEVLKNGRILEDLQTKYDKRKSFYGKAKIIKYNNNLYLNSYNTIVAKIENGKYVDFGKFSATTTRHQKEFKKQFEY